MLKNISTFCVPLIYLRIWGKVFSVTFLPSNMTELPYSRQFLLIRKTRSKMLAIFYQVITCNPQNMVNQVTRNHIKKRSKFFVTLLSLRIFGKVFSVTFLPSNMTEPPIQAYWFYEGKTRSTKLVIGQQGKMNSQ
jgi:hypothetical protein